ncbi:MAG: hypothetical protein ACI9BD_001565, partial [Candidatus Marinamargulisbacteria bacterium]
QMEDAGLKGIGFDAIMDLFKQDTVQDSPLMKNFGDQGKSLLENFVYPMVVLDAQYKAIGPTGDPLRDQAAIQKEIRFVKDPATAADIFGLKSKTIDDGERAIEEIQVMQSMLAIMTRKTGGSPLSRVQIETLGKFEVSFNGRQTCFITLGAGGGKTFLSTIADELLGLNAPGLKIIHIAPFPNKDADWQRLETLDDLVAAGSKKHLWLTVDTFVNLVQQLDVLEARAIDEERRPIPSPKGPLSEKVAQCKKALAGMLAVMDEFVDESYYVRVDGGKIIDKADTGDGEMVHISSFLKATFGSKRHAMLSATPDKNKDERVLNNNMDTVKRLLAFKTARIQDKGTVQYYTQLSSLMTEILPLIQLPKGSSKAESDLRDAVASMVKANKKFELFLEYTAILKKTPDIDDGTKGKLAVLADKIEGSLPFLRSTFSAMPLLSISENDIKGQLDRVKNHGNVDMLRSNHETASSQLGEALGAITTSSFEGEKNNILVQLPDCSLVDSGSDRTHITIADIQDSVLGQMKALKKADAEFVIDNFAIIVRDPNGKRQVLVYNASAGKFKRPIPYKGDDKISLDPAKGRPPGYPAVNNVFCFYTRDSVGGDFDKYSQDNIRDQVIVMNQQHHSRNLYQFLKRDRTGHDSSHVHLRLGFTPVPSERGSLFQDLRAQAKLKDTEVSYLDLKAYYAEKVEIETQNVVRSQGIDIARQITRPLTEALLARHKSRAEFSETVSRLGGASPAGKALTRALASGDGAKTLSAAKTLQLELGKAVGEPINEIIAFANDLIVCEQVENKFKVQIQRFIRDENITQDTDVEKMVGDLKNKLLGSEDVLKFQMRATFAATADGLDISPSNFTGALENLDYTRNHPMTPEERLADLTTQLDRSETVMLARTRQALLPHFEALGIKRDPAESTAVNLAVRQAVNDDMDLEKTGPQLVNDALAILHSGTFMLEARVEKQIQNICEKMGRPGLADGLIRAAVGDSGILASVRAESRRASSDEIIAQVITELSTSDALQLTPEMYLRAMIGELDGHIQSGASSLLENIIESGEAEALCTAAKTFIASADQ